MNGQTRRTCVRMGEKAYQRPEYQAVADETQTMTEST